MPDILQAVNNLVGSFVDDEPKPPLHIGEAMSCWTYITAIAESLTYEQIGLNMTTDPELRDALHEAMKMCDSQVRRIRDFMEIEGVTSPPLSEPKPRSDPSAVPNGVKLTDDEIANGVSIKVAAAIVACASAAAQSIRNDVNVMWLELQQEQMTYGISLKRLMRKRGWLKTPPFYVPPGLPIQ